MEWVWMAQLIVPLTHNTSVQDSNLCLGSGCCIFCSGQEKDASPFCLGPRDTHPMADGVGIGLWNYQLLESHPGIGGKFPPFVRRRVKSYGISMPQQGLQVITSFRQLFKATLQSCDISHLKPNGPHRYESHLEIIQQRPFNPVPSPIKLLAAKRNSLAFDNQFMPISSASSGHSKQRLELVQHSQALLIALRDSLMTSSDNTLQRINMACWYLSAASASCCQE